MMVVGGREYKDQEFVFAILDSFHEAKPITTLIHGGARGADTLAGRWAEARGVSVEEFFADWEIYGRKAGPMRNARMIAEARADALLVFPGGELTQDLKQRARLAGLPVYEPSPAKELATTG